MSFEGFVIDHAGEMKCVSTREALAIIHYLKHTPQDTAIALLQSIDSDRPTGDLVHWSIPDPGPNCVNHFCATLGISIVNPLSIEAARRKNGNTSAIQAFFDRFSQVLDCHLALLLNCDKTHVSSRKRSKALVPDGHLRLQ
jgi:hypothetical protein